MEASSKLIPAWVRPSVLSTKSTKVSGSLASSKLVTSALRPLMTKVPLLTVISVPAACMVLTFNSAPFWIAKLGSPSSAAPAKLKLSRVKDAVMPFRTYSSRSAPTDKIAPSVKSTSPKVPLTPIVHLPVFTSKSEVLPLKVSLAASTRPLSLAYKP